MWLFTLVFALALPVKFFAIIAYILLLIYKEKRVFKLILHMAVSLIPIALLRIAIPFAGESNTGVFATLLFSNVLPVSISAVLFFVVMVVLCAAVYVTKPSDDKLLNNKRIVYISFLGYAVFLLFTTPLPYWYLYLVPFMAMLIAFDKNKLIANLFLEAIASFATVFSHIFVHAHCFSSAIVNNTPLASIIGNKPEINVMFPQLLQKYLSEDFYNQFGNYFAPVFSSVALGAFALYIYINFPSSKKYNLVSDEKVLTDIYLVRLLMVGCLMSIPVLCFILG
jgi:hypothetical protein